MGVQWFKRKVSGLGLTARSSGVTIDSSGGGLVQTGVVSAAAGSTIANYGVTTIARKSSAGASTQLFTLAAPVAGVLKTIFCTNATATRTCRVTLVSGVSFYSSNSTLATQVKVTFKKANSAITMIGLSATKWGVISRLPISTATSTGANEPLISA